MEQTPDTQEVLSQIETKFKEITKGFALDTEIKAELKELKDEFKALKADKTQEDMQVKMDKLNSILEQQGLIISELKSVKPVATAQLGIAEQVKEMILSNDDKFKAFVNKSAPFQMQLKAVGTMLVGTGSNNVTGTWQLLPTPVMTPGYNPARRNPATFLDVPSVGTTGSARIAYVDQIYTSSGENGVPATVAEGAGKPQIDVDYKVSYSSAVKVAAYTKISDEMLDDIDFMAQAVADELISRVRIAVSGNIYTYITSGMTPGYTEVSSTFADYFTLAKYATEWDVFTAAKATLAEANHEANTIFVTPAIFAALNMVKDANARYTQSVLITPTVMSFNGMNIYASNAVAPGKYIVCDINKLNVSIYKDLIVEAGWETADFINNLRTFRGEGRFHYYVKENDKTAFLVGTMATSRNYMTAVA